MTHPSAVIPLLREPSDGEHLDELEPYVRSRCGVYHHRPRAAHRWNDPGRHGLTVHAWCGQLLHGPLPTIEPDGPICGTCEGRFEGWLRRRRLIFAPVDQWGRPTWCPLIDFRTETCPLCGGKPARRYSRWHGADLVRHRAGDDIVKWAPCPQHGWRWMGQRGATVVCRWSASDGCEYEIEEVVES